MILVSEVPLCGSNIHEVQKVVVEVSGSSLDWNRH